MSDPTETRPTDADSTMSVSRKMLLGGLAFLVAAIAVWAASGRRYKAMPSGESAGPNRATRNVWSEELLPIAMDKFNRLEEFVEPEMLNQAIDQLDQWIQGQKPLEGWEVDPMVAAQSNLVSTIAELRELDKLSFSRADLRALEEAVLLRDASNWARGEQVDDLARARQLFDWTVRNIQIVDPRAQPIRQRPWETLVLGNGTLIDRAWVFVLLCRQQGLDAAMLAIYDPNDADKRQLIQWGPAVLIDQKLYPFVADLGVPIPAAGGIQRNEAGQLEIQPATLAQLASDASLLRQLDIDPAHPYPVKASDLKQVVAMVEASPAYLTQRMKMVESRLAGKDKVVLTTSPSALAARLKRCGHVAEVRLWEIPYQLILQRTQSPPEVLQRIVEWQRTAQMPFYVGRSPVLMKGRILHLKGKLSGEPNAAEMYQMARPSDREMDLSQLDVGTRLLYAIAKIHASYWLGLVAMEQNNYRAAVDYFAKRTIEATPGGPWSHAAKYNLGRVYEAMGQPDKAIREYEGDVRSPCLFGNLLRARWLGSKTAKLPPEYFAAPSATRPDQSAAKPMAKPATQEKKATPESRSKPKADDAGAEGAARKPGKK